MEDISGDGRRSEESGSVGGVRKQGDRKAGGRRTGWMNINVGDEGAGMSGRFVENSEWAFANEDIVSSGLDDGVPDLRTWLVGCPVAERFL